MTEFEIRYWSGGEWFPVDEGTLDWLWEVAFHPYPIAAHLPDIRRS